MSVQRLLVLLWISALLPVGTETVRYSYDAAGRLARVEYADGKTITYLYDKAGNLVKRVTESAAPAEPAASAKPRKPAHSGKGTRR